ncbi:MAG: galactose-1-phosphate uridylyltransferase [Candidatus Melainabacteria bacterium GWF2_37_15]|nr:MAG: galactose-1-phosphate uridylyltransferase [Candidatus Melainabacteria bacterium GWF2_37_15]
MPEMRRNPITGEWAIIATERAKRPYNHTFDEDVFISGNAHDSTCCFCYGNEHTTPPEVLTYREKPNASNMSGWTLRVVTNKFSALSPDGEFNITNDGSLKSFTYARGNADVVIESPHHTLNTALFPLPQIKLVLKAYRERYIALAKDPLIQYIAIFKNNGIEAGATLSHPHSQIIATPVVPPVIEYEIAGAKKYFKDNNRCVYCDMIEDELKDGSRVIYENEEFLSFAPYASKSPFETWVMPKFHSSCYEDLTNSQLKSLAQVWKITLYKIYKGLDNPPYNYYIHTSPTQQDTKKFYHWHMELIPKMTVLAGFELGTGMCINIAVPEHSAEYLREVI